MLVALLVCLIPTTIGALLSAIGIAGMDRLVQRNVLAMSGRAVEAAGDVSTLLLDKTGTITYGNRQASRASCRSPGVERDELRDTARLSTLADQTPEGRSIVDLALAAGGRRPRPAAAARPSSSSPPRPGCPASTSPTAREVRKGAGSAVAAWLGVEQRRRGARRSSRRSPASGGTPLVIGRQGAPAAGQVLGVVHLKDVVKDGHGRAVRRAARDGHPHGDDHRRQRRSPRRRSPRRPASTTSSPRPRPRTRWRCIQPGAGGRPARRDDRRRHQRRPGAGRRPTSASR